MKSTNRAVLDQIDDALRLVNREIWVITAAASGRRGGLLATWVSAASIDREKPVLLAGIGPNHFTAQLVQSSKACAAHLLRPDQIDLAWNFANGSGRDRDKLEGLGIEQRETGSPILPDCLAWFDCRVFARYDAGDRLLFWADVVSAIRRDGTAGSALREHDFFRRLSDEQRQKLIADRQADVASNHSLHEEWRHSEPW
jgi:flavin reductase (DIM6/NTAB) family NADH-FMN oxidoreductase RutF